MADEVWKNANTFYHDVFTAVVVVVAAVYKGGFPLSGNVYLRTHVKFSCLSKIASSETQGADSGGERKSTRAEKKWRVGKTEAMNEGRA